MVCALIGKKKTKPLSSSMILIPPDDMMARMV